LPRGCRRRCRRTEQQPWLDRPRHHHLDEQLDERHGDRAPEQHDDYAELDGHDDDHHDHVPQLDRLDHVPRLDDFRREHLRQQHEHHQPEFVDLDDPELQQLFDDPEHDEPELQQLQQQHVDQHRHVHDGSVGHVRPRRSQRPELMSK
jgi:hypothetical protein